MRPILVPLVALLSMAGSDAQARREFPSMTPSGPRIDRVVILEKGTYQARPRTVQQDARSPTGGVRALGGVTLVKNTDTFKPKLGMHFGIRYMIRGFPQGARVPIRIVQRYPIAGLNNPRTKKTTYTYQQSSLKAVGYAAFAGYHLGDAWELVPGIWSFEIWHDGRLLAEQKFELTAQ